jgi:hypothetical protein
VEAILDSVFAFQQDWLHTHRCHPVDSDQGHQSPAVMSTSGEDNFKTLALVDAAYLSASRHGQVVPVQSMS